MKVRWIGFVIIAICGGVIVWIGSQLQSELAPMEDRSQFRLQVTAPEGTSFDYMDKYMDRLIQFYARFCSGKKNRNEHDSTRFQLRIREQWHCSGNPCGSRKSATAHSRKL